VFTLTPVSVDLTLSMESVDTPVDDFKDASLLRFAFLVRAAEPLAFTLAFTAPIAGLAWLLLFVVVVVVVVAALFAVRLLIVVVLFIVVASTFVLASSSTAVLAILGSLFIVGILSLAGTSLPPTEPLFISAEVIEVISDPSDGLASLGLIPRAF
jgi:hypothetical protein